MLCSNCSFKVAQKRCEACADVFCADCASFHSRTKRRFRGHKTFTDLGADDKAASRRASICSNCDSAVAKFLCIDCQRSGGGDGAYFCLGCSVFHHRVKLYMNHSLEPLQSWNAESRSSKQSTVTPEMTIEEESGDDDDDDGGGGGAGLSMLFEGLSAWVKRWEARLEKLTTGMTSRAILQDKQGAAVLIALCICGHLLLKTLLGRHVSIVVAVGGIVGLRWMQQTQRKQSGNGALAASAAITAATVVDIKRSKALDDAAAAVFSSSTSSSSAAGGGVRRATSAAAAAAAAAAGPPLRSLSAAAAALETAESSGEFHDEFWYADKNNGPSRRPMRVQVKDRKPPKFNANSDT